MLRRKCRECEWYDTERKKWRYSYMVLTNWLPPRGINQRLREFRCFNCGMVVYLELSVEEFKREGVFRF